MVARDARSGRQAHSRTRFVAPIAHLPWPAPAPAPDRDDAHARRSSVAAAREASPRSSQPERQATSPPPPRRRGRTSSECEPSLDDLTRRQRKLDAGGARRVRIRALRPHLGPGAVARQIREAEARNTGEQRIRGRRDTAWSIVPGPVQHFDNAFPQAIAYPLAGTARLEVELG